MINKIRQAAIINVAAIKKAANASKAGIALKELDLIIEREIVSLGGSPAFKGYNGFPGSSCLSLNNCAIHGIPGNQIIRDGDILTIDVGTIFDGYYADSAITIGIGTISQQDQNLIKATKGVLYSQIEAAKPGASLYDLVLAAQKAVEIFGGNVIDSLGGHFIGTALHMEPFIPSGLASSPLSAKIQIKKYKEQFLKEGDTLCIEPVLTMGNKDYYVDSDNWSVYMKDGSRTAHFEHLILINKEGCEILT